MNTDGLLDREAIQSLINEVADELPDDVQRGVLMVGGSLLAWHGLRESTEDVDSIRQMDDTLKHAVLRVARRHQLASDWLNDHATAFGPAALDVEEWEVLLDRPQLRVLGAPLHVVFLMKLRRADPADLQDLRVIWSHLGNRYPTATDVVRAFYAAFPDEPHDEFLGTFVVDELAKGGISLPPR